MKFKTLNAHVFTFGKILAASVLLNSFTTGSLFASPIYNIKIADNLPDGIWMNHGESVSGHFDISGLRNIDILSGSVHYTFFADNDGYSSVGTEISDWVYVYRGDGDSLFDKDNYYERTVVNHFADEAESASVVLLSASTHSAFAPSTSTGNVHQTTTGYNAHHWGWEGRIRQWDNYGLDKIYDEYTDFSGLFNIDMPLSLAMAKHLDISDILPFNITSTFGDFLLVSSNLDLTYSPMAVPEPASIVLMGMGLAGLVSKFRFSKRSSLRRRPWKANAEAGSPQ